MMNEIRTDTFRIAGKSFTLKFFSESFNPDSPVHREIWETAIRDYWLRKARYSAITITERASARRAAMVQYIAAIKSAQPKLSQEAVEAQALTLLKTLQPDLFSVPENGTEFDYSNSRLE